MKNTIEKLTMILLIATLAIVANAAIKDERIRLKNGKSKSEITLNPSRTYKFVISGKQFKTLKIALQSSGGKFKIEIRSPRSKTLANSTGKNFTVKNIGAGDYQVLVTNLGKNKRTAIIKFEGVDGESKD